MASLSEMMQYAQYVGQNRNPLPGVLESAASGYTAGVHQRQTQAQQHLDTMLKIMDIQEKVQKLQLQKRTADLNENIAKAKGLIPLDTNEADVAKNTAWNMMGDKTPRAPNTAEGKIATMANTGNWKGHWSVKNGWSFTEMMSGEGKKTGGSRGGGGGSANSELNAQKADLIWAEKMARDEEMKKQQAAVPPDVRGTILEKQIRPSDITIAPDTLAKYVPLAHALRTKNFKEYARLVKANDPNAVVPPLSALAAQVQQMQTQLIQKTKQMDQNSAVADAPGVVWDTGNSHQKESEGED